MGNPITCRIGSCQRHQKCMYTPCRHNPASELFTEQARQQGKTLAAAKERVRKVAEGGTINGTYRWLPGESVDVFRADLLMLVEACP